MKRCNLCKDDYFESIGHTCPASSHGDVKPKPEEICEWTLLEEDYSCNTYKTCNGGFVGVIDNFKGCPYCLRKIKVVE